MNTRELCWEENASKSFFLVQAFFILSSFHSDVGYLLGLNSIVSSRREMKNENPHPCVVPNLYDSLEWNTNEDI